MSTVFNDQETLFLRNYREIYLCYFPNILNKIFNYEYLSSYFVRTHNRNIVDIDLTENLSKTFYDQNFEQKEIYVKNCICDSKKLGENESDEVYNKTGHFIECLSLGVSIHDDLYSYFSTSLENIKNENGYDVFKFDKSEQSLLDGNTYKLIFSCSNKSTRTTVLNKSIGLTFSISKSDITREFEENKINENTYRNCLFLLAFLFNDPETFKNYYHEIINEKNNYG